MKKYIKIIGIINFIIVLTIIVSIAIVVFNANGEDALTVLLLFIPTYFIIHFLITYKFGFINIEVLEKKYDRLLYIGSVFLIVSIFSIVVFSSSKYFIEKRRISKLENQFSVSKNWGFYTTAYGFTSKLSTKFENRKLNYQLSIHTNVSNQYRLNNISEYIIEFFDKDGFKIEEVNVPHFTNIIDSIGNKIGASANSSYYYNIEDYARIKSWGISIREK